MKKLLLSLGLIGMFGGIISFASANNTSCKQVEFSNGVTACVNIEKVSTNQRRLSTTVDNGSTANLRCDIMTPDSVNHFNSSSSCNQDFYYNGSSKGQRTKIWIRYVVSYQNELAPSNREGKPNSNSQRTYPQWEYDFNNEGRFDDYINNNYNNNYSNGDLNNFYLTTDDSTPSTSQYVDLTVKARDSSNYTLTDYTDSINFKVYYRASSSSSWVQTTSSSYYTMSSSYKYGYDFTSSDDGIAELTNFIKFTKNNYEYKVRVYDENDTSIYKEITFNVGSSSNYSNGDLNNFYLTTDDSTPSTSQYIDLTVKARDSSNYTLTDYTDSINYKVYYRASSSSSWVQTTSSSYYTMSSTYRYGYDFTSSNNGVKTLSNFIKFTKNNYEYKVRVYDENDTSIYKEITFNVGSSSNYSNGDLNNFYLTTDDSTPATYQYVDLNISARDSSNYTLTDFSDTVKFKVYYKSYNSSSWIQTSSSSYYTMASNYNTYGYSFSTYDNGIANLNNFIQFKNSNYDYKVRVYDVNNSSIYKEIIFYVNGSSSSSSSTYGFSSDELNTVQDIYNGRDDMINSLEDSYSNLYNSSTRHTKSDNFRIAMEEIINNNYNKTYNNYSDFYDAWLDWYRYTISIR